MASRRMRIPAAAVLAVFTTLLPGCDNVRAWRMQQNDQVVNYVPAPEEYCYRTLADIDCYPRPDKRDATRRVQ
ncbi:MAG: hypothetical protein U1F33_16780 [Alphaproteobacteria bacterium]